MTQATPGNQAPAAGDGSPAGHRRTRRWSARWLPAGGVAVLATGIRMAPQQVQRSTVRLYGPGAGAARPTVPARPGTSARPMGSPTAAVPPSAAFPAPTAAVATLAAAAPAAVGAGY